MSQMRSAPGRTAAAAVLAGRDLAGLLAETARPVRTPLAAGALDAAMSWLCRTHDVTGRRGSSKGFSLVRGWLPAYPETTGYMVGTLLACVRRGTARDEMVARAREMGSWEREIQGRDGGVMEGAVGPGPRRSIVFNTDMVLHGWIDLGESERDGYEDAAAGAVDFLRRNLGPTGPGGRASSTRG